MDRSRSVVSASLLLILLFCGAAAQAPALDQIAESATEHGVSNGLAQVNVTLRNDSQKTISAWMWSVEARYADGSTESHSGTVDVVSDLLESNKGLSFRPATSRTFQDAFPLGAHADLPTSAVASLSMVVFDDDTAIGDRVRIARLAASRRSLAADAAEELVEIQKAVKDPSPKEAIRAALVDREAKRPGGGMLRQILSQLENHAPPDAMESAQAVFRAHQALLASHSTLLVE